MSSAVAELRKQGLRIESINVQNSPAAMERYNVRKLPTFIYFLDQQEIRRKTGYPSTGALMQMWRKPMF